MKENLQKFKCGGCGNDKYNIYQQEGNDQELFTECTNCKAVTIVGFTQPRINLAWDDDSDAIMAIY